VPERMAFSALKGFQLAGLYMCIWSLLLAVYFWYFSCSRVRFFCIWKFSFLIAKSCVTLDVIRMLIMKQNTH